MGGGEWGGEKNDTTANKRKSEVGIPPANKISGELDSTPGSIEIRQCCRLLMSVCLPFFETLS